MKTVKWIALGLFAIILLILLSPLAFAGHMLYRLFSKKYDVWYYFNALAVGVDSLGASFIYGSKNHTISAITGYKAYNGDRWHVQQEKAIDKLFGKSHCLNEAKDEKLIRIDNE